MLQQVSVIIPAYNNDQHLEKCLISVRKQIYKNYEVIVVDDGSTDNTYAIAEKYARVVRLKHNLGGGAARNEGAKVARGEILAFTDADVVLPVDWLEKIVKNMNSNGVRCVGGGYCGSLDDSFIEMFAYYELLFRRKDVPRFVNTLVANNFACCKDVFFEFGGFSGRSTCADMTLSYLISRKYDILWDRNNSVYHHFKRDIKGYLRQQYHFARDTVLAYYEYPGLISVKTHQGRGLYLEVLLMFFGTAALFFYPPLSLVLFVAILLLNVPFLRYLKSNRLDLLKSVCTIYMRNLICTFGVISGVLHCLRSRMNTPVQDRSKNT